MPEVIRCPDCGNRYPYNAKLAGQSVLCAGCGGAIEVPAIAPQPKSTAGKIRCNGCGASYRKNPKLAGKQIPCPACGQAIQVPEEEPQLVPLEEAAAIRRPADASLSSRTKVGQTGGEATKPVAESKVSPKPIPTDEGELSLAPIEDLDKPKTAPKQMSPTATVSPAPQPGGGEIPLAAPEPPVLGTTDFFDQELQLAPVASEDAAPAPPRHKKKKRRRKKKKSLMGVQLEPGAIKSLAIGGCLLFLALFVFAFARDAMSRDLFAVIGIGLIVVGKIWFIVIAFQAGPEWGIGCLLCNFIAIAFFIMHLEETWKPFAMITAGVILIVFMQ